MAELESFSFGDSAELANELLELVLMCEKTATCWAASEGDKGAAVGKRWITKDAQGRPSVILETVELARRRFGDVDAAFAHDEGEGDRSLEYWRKRTPSILLGGVNSRRIWSSIASDSGWWRS
jgi:uncharacterized protein YhfF